VASGIPTGLYVGVGGRWCVRVVCVGSRWQVQVAVVYVHLPPTKGTGAHLHQGAAPRPPHLSGSKVSPFGR
jgi:hypothetical protein